MPFDFLKRNKAPAAPALEADAAAAAAPVQATGPRGHAFEGFSEEWHLTGTMAVEGRLSDALNKREPIEINDVRWAPIDGSSPLADAPGLRSIDPYDLIVVIAGAGSLPEMSDDEKKAHRIHKVRYDLALDAPPFRVIGTVYLHPGAEPGRLLDRSSEMFLPVVDARATISGRPIETGGAKDILINRVYLRGVEQVDLSTGEASAPIPGLTPGSPGYVPGGSPDPE